MRAIILLFANILFNSIPGKYRDNAESFAINNYTSESGRKCQSYKMFKSRKVSAAHFERRTGMNLFSKDAQWPTFGTNPGILLADSVPKSGTDYVIRLADSVPKIRYE